MHTNRHRKPKSVAPIAVRTAVSTGVAASAVLLGAGGASANIIPCTGYPLDSVTKSVTMEYCGGGPSVTR